MNNPNISNDDIYNSFMYNTIKYNIEYLLIYLFMYKLVQIYYLLFYDGILRPYLIYHVFIIYILSTNYSPSKYPQLTMSHIHKKGIGSPQNNLNHIHKT